MSIMIVIVELNDSRVPEKVNSMKVWKMRSTDMIM